MNDKKIIRAWAFYDWANSVYALVITTAIFPIFYESVTSEQVVFFGFHFLNTELYSYILSIGFIITAFSLPFLAAFSDTHTSKLKFLKFFCYFGAFSCMILYFFNPQNLEWSMLPVVLALVGFNASIIFYNSFLPLIVSFNHFDRVSAMGYGYGYVGSVILLVICLILLEVFDMPAKWSFVLTGLWWIGFSQITFHYLSKIEIKKYETDKKMKDSFKRLKITIGEIKKNKSLKYYLAAFFVYSMAVQTIMYLAVFFGTKSVSWSSDSEKSTGLIVTILAIQILAIFGAYFISKISKKIGNINALILMVIFWILVCLYAYYFVYTPISFYIAGICIGLVMGAIQSISRSTFSKFIFTYSQQLSSYYSIYDFIEKISIVVGVFLYGFIEGITHNIRNSILVLILFFVVGLCFLIPIRTRKIINKK